VAQGSGVSFVTYQYESTATTGSIERINRFPSSSVPWSLNGDQATMYVAGRENWPIPGSTINVSGTDSAPYNTTYLVEEAAPTVTEGPATALKVTRAAGGTFEDSMIGSGGTWAFPSAPITEVFEFTGSEVEWDVPGGITSMSFEVLGAQGGKSGGGGGRVTGNLTEIPGNSPNIPATLKIVVGGAGTSNANTPGGFGGGGTSGGDAGVEGSGGGASYVYFNSPSLGLTPLVIAGGGGGRGSGLGSGGGAGGGLVANNGRTGQGVGGTGGTQTEIGIGGATNGTAIVASTNGQSILIAESGLYPGMGGTGARTSLHGGGGGGGGYYGGGGGGGDEDACCTDGGGGGGGSSYTDPAFVADVVHTQGVRPGNGRISITYTVA
jgi:hypothetical protein